MPGSVPQMLRVLFGLAVTLAIAGAARADDIDVCRDRQAEAKARLAACESLIAGAKVTGKDLAIALSARGSAQLARHDLDKAIATFGAAHDADPDNIGYLISRGVAYEDKGDDDHAMADYNLVLQMRPNTALALNNRATLYLRKGAVQSALSDFNAAVAANPKLYFAHTGRGRVLTVTRDFDGALADFAEAERIDPAPPQARTYRCATYTAMGQFEKAIADCNSVIEKAPRSEYALVSRANAYLGKGDLDAALKDYNFVLGFNPNSVRAHAGRGQLFEDKHDPAQARADYRSAAYALTPYDNYDSKVAREKARARLAALTPQAPAGANAGGRIALIVGNGAYKNVHQLDNPPRDASLIAGALRDVGFQTVTLANDLSRDKFFEALHAFASEAEKADWAVVYYAGHGLEIGGVNYLVPVDARLASDRDVESEAVALEQVIAAVGGARKLRLVMLDACRDNPFAPAMQRTIGLKLVDRGLSNIEPEAASWWSTPPSTARPRSTATASTARSPSPWRTTSGSRVSRSASCSTSSATTSGLSQNTSSSPSPTARRRDGKTSISRQGSS
jgi:tetratricopeptide (TPR) repeat protein